MIIKTEFDVGDNVYHGCCVHEDSSITCPDCIGQRICTVHFMNDRVVEMACPTCKNPWESTGGRISFKIYKPEVVKLTIGSISFSPEDGSRYMCKETGVGSGRVYKESTLSKSRNIAQKQAEKDVLQNAKRQAEVVLNEAQFEDIFLRFGSGRQDIFEEIEKIRAVYEILKNAI